MLRSGRTFFMHNGDIELETAEQEWIDESYDSYREFDDIVEDFVCHPLANDIIIAVKRNYMALSREQDEINYDKLFILSIHQFRYYIFHMCSDIEQSAFYSRVEIRRANRLINDWVTEDSDEDEPLFPVSRAQVTYV